jgi:release factor glutamine methyltransferase
MRATAMGAAAEPRSTSTVTVRELLLGLTEQLARSGVFERPDVEAGELLAALLDQPRWWPRLHVATSIDASLRDRALAAAAKRMRGAPLAYCVGRAAFRRLMLEVDERVLIPRVETEQLVDVALSLVGAAGGGVAIDVGTGSGAIALSLATEATFDRVIATEVSLDALAVARRNAERLRDSLRTTVEFRHGSLMAPVQDVRPRLVISNPPYIANPEAGVLPSSVRDWEPPAALLSGPDGLRATARLVREAAERLIPGGALALEVDSRRAGAVGDLAARDEWLTDVKVLRDLTGRDRFVVARRKEDG